MPLQTEDLSDEGGDNRHNKRDRRAKGAFPWERKSDRHQKQRQEKESGEQNAAAASFPRFAVEKSEDKRDRGGKAVPKNTADLPGQKGKVVGGDEKNGDAEGGKKPPKE